tara:strand:+ start:155 stop:505 length:351 start_codon:yes stop_codon:yes gene_type:complete
MSAIPELTRLERHDTSMELTYDNGNQFTVTYDDLRYSCPCAKCAPLRNDDESSKSLRRQVESMPAEKPKVRTIGKYALAFDWVQGCSSGIYRFERIWALANNEDPDGGRPYVHGVW